MARNHQKGFTLIELIVVVVIIGVIAAIAIPQYYTYKTRADRSVIISDCNAIYRGFVVYFIEQDEYPFQGADATGDGLDRQFKLDTFSPLIDERLMGMNIGMEINVNNLKNRLHNNRAEAFDSPDLPLGLNQAFYLVLPWAADPGTKFIVAQSEHVKYADGTEVDGGNWLDGVYMSDKDGNLIR